MAVPVSAAALLHARREYRRRGRLGALGLFLLCLMLFLPDFALEYPTRYEMPEAPLDYVGVVLCVVAAGLVPGRAGGGGGQPAPADPGRGGTPAADLRSTLRGLLQRRAALRQLADIRTEISASLIWAILWTSRITVPVDSALFKKWRSEQ